MECGITVAQPTLNGDLEGKEQLPKYQMWIQIQPFFFMHKGKERLSMETD
jgi:hypothetical protein